MKREHDLKHPLSLALAPLILAMCRHPEDCRLVESLEPRHPTLTLKVTPHRADFKVVCGRAGRQINALRYFAQRAGEVQGIDADVALEEGLVGRQEPPRDFEQDPQFDVAALLASLRNAADLLFGRHVQFTHERACDELRVEFDVNPDEPEDVPSVYCLADIFYPATFRRGLVCKIRVRKRPEPAPAT